MNYTELLRNLTETNTNNEENINPTLPTDINLLLTGGGLASYYEGGVLKYLTKFSQNTNKLNIKNIYCVSGGALFGVLYIADIDIEDVIITYNEVKNDPIKSKKHVTEVLKEMLIKFLPEDIHIKCNDRLTIFVYDVISYITQNRIAINRFESRADLIDIITASCSIPYVTKTSGCYKCRDNKYYIDGIDIDMSLIKESNNLPNLIIDLDHVPYSTKHKINFIDNSIHDIVIKGMNDIHNFIYNEIHNDGKNIIKLLEPTVVYKGCSLYYKIYLWSWDYLKGK